jgi:hypothetical protein
MYLAADSLAEYSLNREPCSKVRRPSPFLTGRAPPSAWRELVLRDCWEIGWQAWKSPRKLQEPVAAQGRWTLFQQALTLQIDFDLLGLLVLGFLDGLGSAAGVEGGVAVLEELPEPAEVLVQLGLDCWISRTDTCQFCGGLLGSLRAINLNVLTIDVTTAE